MRFYYLILSILISIESSASQIDEYYRLEREINKLNSLYNRNQEEIFKNNTLLNHLLSKEEVAKKIKEYHTENKIIIKQLAPLKEKLYELEDKISVKAISGELESLSNVKDKMLCTKGSRLYFKSDKDFEEWNLEYGSEERRVSYYANKSPYMKACLENRPQDKVVEVDYRSMTLCNKESMILNEMGSQATYKTYIKDNLINIDVSLYLKFEGDDKDRDESFRLVRESMPCVKKFYARHGLKLNVELKEETGMMDRFKCDHTIHITKEHDRPNATNWATHKYAKSSKLNDEKRCLLYIHELAHNLGLPDAYRDGKCPDRRLILPKDNIMASGPQSVMLWQANFNGNQIRNILSPLCD